MAKMTSRLRSWTVCAGAILLAAPSRVPAAAPVDERPNIIFIMADDMGYADLSCYGAQGYQTPAIDRLAAEGERFSQAYVSSPVCSPSRASLLTGQYPGRFNAGLNEPNTAYPAGQELPLATPTIASTLRSVGYRTSLIGKWHLTEIPQFSPTRYGYDHFFGIKGGAADYFTHKVRAQTDDPALGLYEDDRPVSRDGYLTNVLTDEAVRQIRASGPKPLFLSLHFNAPHWPWEGPEDGERSRSLKDLWDRSGGSLETYAAMMKNMDANVARVLDAIDAAGKRRNTIVIFTSDNGGERYSNMWPLTGYKGELLEGGIRVPFIIRWPGHIRAGSRSDQVISLMDMLPTFAAAARAPVPTRLDGENMLPHMIGRSPDAPRTMFWRFKASEQGAVRQGDWKYLRLGGKEHLFDVRKDPHERADLKEVYPQVLAELKAKWAAWNAQMLPYPAGSFSESVADTFADRYPEAPTAK